MHLDTGLLLRAVVVAAVALVGALPADRAAAASLEVFHADSLGGPMKEIKKAFEETRPGVTVNLTSGTSKQLAERILKGDACDAIRCGSGARPTSPGPGSRWPV